MRPQKPTYPFRRSFTQQAARGSERMTAKGVIRGVVTLALGGFRSLGRVETYGQVIETLGVQVK